MNDQKYFALIWLTHSGIEKLSSDYTTEMYNFPHKILEKDMPFFYNIWTDKTFWGLYMESLTNQAQMTDFLGRNFLKNQICCFYTVRA